MAIDKRQFALKLRKLVKKDNVDYPREMLKAIDKFYKARNLTSGQNVPEILVSLLNLLQVNNGDVFRLQKILTDNIQKHGFRKDEVFYILSSLYSNAILGKTGTYVLKYQDKDYEIALIPEMMEYYAKQNKNPDQATIAKAIINLVDNMNFRMVELENELWDLGESLEIPRDPNLFYVLSSVFNAIEYQALEMVNI
ncbi:MAG: hypothetical protein ACYCS1_04325 [Gammaproteobacteria bacterium]